MNEETETLMGNKKVAIIMGSKSDAAIAEKAEKLLHEFSVEVETLVISAHRNPNRIRNVVRAAESNGVAVFIAIAGLAAHLPGVIASLSVVPVIGVPVSAGALHGKDALYSIVQMPPGIPVGCVGIDNARNAALLAVQILGCSDESFRVRMKEYRTQFGDDAR
jgi:5-(carboxyamino)imidazole ribonucleotide mutase